MLIEFHRKMLADGVRSAAFEAALRRVIRPGETTVADIGAGTGRTRLHGTETRGD